MRKSTKEKLDNVLRYPWFKSCGRPLPESVTRVRDWLTVKQEITSRKWVNCRLMAGNALQWTVQTKQWDRIQDWNPLADELRPVIEAFLRKSLPTFPIPPALVEKIRPKVDWDIMCICMEQEFLDLSPPTFYISQLDPWYAAGHLPCGWDGEEFPEHWDGIIRQGRLMVF